MRICLSSSLFKNRHKKVKWVVKCIKTRYLITLPPLPPTPFGYKTRESTQTACCHDINSNCVKKKFRNGWCLHNYLWMNLIISPPYLFLISLNQFDSSIFRTFIIYNLRFIVLFFILDSRIYEHFFNFIQG